MWGNMHECAPLKTNKHISEETTEYFHIARSVDSLISIWKHAAAQQNITFQAKISTDLPDVLKIDAFKVQHCLNNLVENAVTHTQNGNIFIAITLIKISGKEFVALSVCDNGGGIETNKQGNVFSRPIMAPKPNTKNYGVVDTGLPMTKNLVEELGGRIIFKSTEHIGSTFSLVLPLLAKSTLNTVPPKCPILNSQNPYCDLNVLIVDDYNLNQLTIKALLHGIVATTHIASHGYQALEILHTCPIDIIFMDIHMPIMDGIEATMKIRNSQRTWSSVKIIALTADPNYQHTHLCKKIGMDGALAKPVKRVELLKTFESLIG